MPTWLLDYYDEFILFGLTVKFAETSMFEPDYKMSVYPSNMIVAIHQEYCYNMCILRPHRPSKYTKQVYMVYTSIGEKR